MRTWPLAGAGRGERPRPIHGMAKGVYHGSMGEIDSPRGPFWPNPVPGPSFDEVLQARA